jgi:hypothetical protein
MKTKYFYPIVLALILVMFSCNKKEDGIIQIKSSIEFTFALDKQEELLKSAQTDTVTDATDIVLSIETPDGKVVLSNKRLSISKNDSNYISEPFEIEAGTYKLTKFLVINKENMVIHAVPYGYSKKSDPNDDLLPLSFSIENSQAVKMKLQVTNAIGKNPQDLGYASFSFDQEPTFDVMIGVYTYNPEGQGFSMTNAKLTIEEDSKIIFDQDIQSDISKVTIKEGQGKYIFTVSKDGYNTWKDTLAAYNLVKYSVNPFSVLLEKPDEHSISFITNQDTITPLNINIKSFNTNKKLRVNWGDGIIETASATCKLTHEYSVPADYKVSITGNIDDINYIFLKRCGISSIDLKEAINLDSIEISRNSYLKTLDLSGKPNLKKILCVEGNIETINLINSDNIETLYCSLNRLKTLDIANLKSLKTLYCDRNLLSALVVANSLNLQRLCCYQNNISDLDISNNTYLENINLSNNKFSNQSINNLLVALLQNVKSSPHKGSFSGNMLLSGTGEKAKLELEKDFGWIVQ